MVNGADHAAAVFTDRTRDWMSTDSYSSSRLLSAPRGREVTCRSLISCFAARANKQLARDETDGCTMPEPIWSSSPRLACEVPEDDPLAGESETVANSCASTLPTEVTDPNVGDPPS